jgi:hypothetical protein
LKQNWISANLKFGLISVQTLRWLPRCKYTLGIKCKLSCFTFEIFAFHFHIFRIVISLQAFVRVSSAEFQTLYYIKSLRIFYSIVTNIFLLNFFFYAKKLLCLKCNDECNFNGRNFVLFAKQNLFLFVQYNNSAVLRAEHAC